MPFLQDKLDQITSNTRRLVQPERLAISEQATAELFATGIEDHILPIGAVAPSFTLEDASTGKPVRSADLLSLGPLVLNFFRGRWCPYCITELETWRDLYPRVRAVGAVLVAISPQNGRHNAFTADQLGSTAQPAHKAPPNEKARFAGKTSPASAFPILSDPEGRLAEQFGLVYTIPPAARRYYRSILVNIPLANSGKSYDTAPDSAWRLPIPATFVLRQDGTVAFAEAHADFRVRPEPADVLAALAGLASNP